MGIKKVKMKIRIMIILITCFMMESYHSLGGAKHHESKISIYSQVVQAPLLKGLSVNPMHRITIHVPAGFPELRLNSMGCSLNSESRQLIDSLQVYFTGAEPDFITDNLMASIKPSQESLEIPVNIVLQPGKYYLWVSSKLHENADIDKKAILKVQYLTDSKNKKLPIQDNSPGYAHRLGIVLKKAGEDKVHTYRIPGITRTSQGTLIAVYDNRYDNTRDLPGNIDVGMSRSTNGGKSWEPMKVIIDMGPPHENNGVGDPTVLFDPATNRLWVAALWSKGNRSIAGSKPGLSPDETGQFVLVSSDDDGNSWSTPQSITPQIKDPKWKIYFNGPGNGIVMEDGRLVFPSQYWDEDGIPHSSIVYSNDHGKTWNSGLGAKSNTTESQVVETTPGTLMLNMRDNRGNYRSVATTTDLGKTWTEHHTSYEALPDPVCMGSFIKARVKSDNQLQDVLFFNNPNAQCRRHNITLKASLDLGESWLPEDQILIDERSTFGYSALTIIDENTLGLLYEGIRELYFVRIPVQDVVKSDLK